MTRVLQRNTTACLSVVRGVAVLDRQSVPLVLQLYGEDEGALCMERILYASLDRLDEMLMMGDTTEDQGGSDGQRGGLYLGRLTSVGLYSVYGFLTSVNKRVLLCLKEDQTREKIGDGTMNDVMADIADAYADHEANPFVGQSPSSTDAFSCSVTDILRRHMGENGVHEQRRINI